MRGLMDTPRRPYRHGNLANALRAAARAILDEAGQDAVGLREVSRRVGRSPPAAYRHFTSKEALLASVAAEGFRELAAVVGMAANEGDPLRAVGLAYVEFALQKRGLFRLMFGPILPQRAKYPELDEAARAVFGLLQGTAANADEQAREDNSAGMEAWGLVHGLSTLFIDGLVPEAQRQSNGERDSRPKGFDPNTRPPYSADGHHVYIQCLNVPVVTKPEDGTINIILTDENGKRATEIVVACVANNSLPRSDLPALFKLCTPVESLGKGSKVAQLQAETKPPAVPTRKSITPDYLVCLKDVKRFKSLRPISEVARPDAGTVSGEIGPVFLVIRWLHPTTQPSDRP